jgi:hypothetical protein
MLISSSKSGDRMCPVSIALGKGKPLGCNGEKCALFRWAYTANHEGHAYRDQWRKNLIERYGYCGLGPEPNILHWESQVWSSQYEEEVI